MTIKIILLILSVYSITANSHSGRTNKDGCHNNKKTNDYHCHNSDSKKQKSTISSSIKKTSIFGEISPANDNIKRLDYEGFTIWHDCSKRSAVKFQYVAQRDTGNFKRKNSFYIDPNVPKECQQKSTKSYKNKGGRYDRGHLVPANHLDYSQLAIKQSNHMTNIMPQSANMNRGAWLLTEEITECYRDIDELLIIGGIIFNGENSNDYFIKSHGVNTPSAFWKVIIRNNRVIAWIVPNNNDATRKRLDDYIVSIDDIERVTGEIIPVADYLKNDKPSSSWLIPRGCDKG